MTDQHAPYTSPQQPAPYLDRDRDASATAKAIGSIAAITAILIHLTLAAATAGISLLITLPWMIPLAAVGRARGRRWYNIANWLLWAGIFGIFPMFVPTRQPSPPRA